MAKEEKKAPKLRFNGYTNDWEHVKPKKYLKISKVPGSNGLIAKKLTVKLWGKGVVEKDTTFNGSENTKYFTRKSGQLMYGKLDFLHAAFGIVPQNLNNYESTADSPAFDINDAGDRTFLINYFLRPEFYLKNGEKANGSRKAKRIHEETFLNMPMQAPIKSEQEKIAKTFNSLNNTIQLHERKCEELTLIKKSLLQKLFPKEDKIKPEIRYKNFSDAWEQRKLGEVFDTVTDYVANGSFKSLRDNVKSYTKENYAYMIRLQDASNNWKGPWLYTDEAGYSFLTKSKLHPNDIIMSNVGSVGKFFLIPELDKPMTLAPNAVLIKSSKNNALFLYQMMISTPMQVAVGRKTTPGVQLKINKTDFKRIQTNLPSLNEQEKIGEFFKQLDSLIALHQRKLEKLKQLKKFLLQNMFI